MTDRPTLDSFERSISAGLERYVAGAVDPRPASEIADAAMRPAGSAGRLRNGRRSRRLFYLAIAAVLLIPAAYVGATLLKPPEPELLAVLPSPPPASASPAPTQGEPSEPPVGDLAIFVRRTDGDDPGISLVAVRPDGGEQPLRHLSDAEVDADGTMSEWGSVSESGWIALAMDNQGGPWPMILVDLRDPESEPWVIDQASLGGIGPRWGPNGQVAAMIDFESLVLADPEAHTTSVMSMQGYGLVGGGPSIVWTADGRGIVGSTDGAYAVVPIDGSDPVTPVGQIFQSRVGYGPEMATLQICSVGAGCTGEEDGRVEIVSAVGAARTIWQQEGTDRALDARFGSTADEYWLALEANGGRQYEIVHLAGDEQATIATVNRDASWQSVEAPLVSSDQLSLVSSVYLGDAPAAVVVEPSGSQTFHTGYFAGFTDDASLATQNANDFAPPNETMPPVGVGYQLPTLEELIAAETELNPGRIVLGSESRDAVDGETTVETYLVPADAYEGAEVYLDCLGPSPVTVTIGSSSTTSPCLTAGSYGTGGNVSASEPVVVEASGDTSWRVVVYGFGQNPGSTAPPDAEPSGT